MARRTYSRLRRSSQSPSATAVGGFHGISEQHLQRDVGEFAFGWNNRSSLGAENAERAALMVKGAIGKLLTYRQLDQKMEA